MAENISEPEAVPSTSQGTASLKAAIFPLVSMPKIVLTRLDLENLPVPIYSPGCVSPTKKPVKRLNNKKNKTLVSDSLTTKTFYNVKHATRFRGKPKTDYKSLSELGKFPIKFTKSAAKVPSEKVGGVVKKSAKVIQSQEDNTVRGMLNKTMLQKRSKIAIPPAKKPKLVAGKSGKITAETSKSKKEKSNAAAPTQKKGFSPKVKDSAFQCQRMDIDGSEDEFLYDELIDELVNSPSKKATATEKTTNITLKPNIGDKPPTIVKGGIVKKSSLPPSLKSVASPSTLNSYKLTGATTVKNTQAAVENMIKTTATAETPKASLPIKASPFPISINASPSKPGPKDQGKRSQKKSAKSTTVVHENPPMNSLTPKGPSKQTKVSPKPKLGGKSVTPPKPRGRPRMGPKQAIKEFTTLNTAGDESDEYTEVETLEPEEHVANPSSDSTENEDIQIVSINNTNGETESGNKRPITKSQNDVDPNLDLLRILTDDTEDASQSEPGEPNPENTGSPQSGVTDNPEPNMSSSPAPSNDSQTRNVEPMNNVISDNPVDLEVDNKSSQDNELSSVHASDETSDKTDDVLELPSETVEETQPIRTVYDLMSEVSLQYPSWNLHIIPETNAFCIAQVTKGRLGLPTLKKCIELDPDTYFAKVYIHQYHIKRFDGVYDSEEAILALIEEIHSIKA